MREVSIDGQPVRLGSRAFEILELLIHSDGALVTKNDIIRKVWPDTVVEENNLQVHISTLRRLLGDDRDLIKTVPGRGYRMVRRDALLPLEPVPNPDPLRTRPAVASGNVTSDARQSAEDTHHAQVHNVPAWTSLLVGREQACIDIAQQLEHTRHLSIVGAGGIGKTRLAIEVARNVLPRFDGHVYFLSLAALNDSNALLDAFGKATGTQRDSGSHANAVERTVFPFAHKTALFVLDNCEHLIIETTALAEALLRHCADVRILATSRESLRSAAETLYPLAPLTIPPSEATESRIVACSAVTLFLTRARAIDPSFGRDSASAMLIGAICRRLDGIPLAIELAAARAVALGLYEVWENLDDRFNTLTGGHRTAVPRHQTLKATFDWSHDLLNADEQRVLRRLSVFEDSFTLASAKAVIRDTQIGEAAIVSAVIGLAAKSLLVTTQKNGTIRYSFLETTRAYAMQKLDDNGEHRSMVARYALVAKALKKNANVEAPPTTSDGVFKMRSRNTYLKSLVQS